MSDKEFEECYQEMLQEPKNVWTRNDMHFFIKRVINYRVPNN